MSLLGSGLVYARPDWGSFYSRARNNHSHPERLSRRDLAKPSLWDFGPAVLHLLAGRLRQRRQPQRGPSDPPCGLAGISLRLRGVV
jgi:hypothetical protein